MHPELLHKLAQQHIEDLHRVAAGRRVVRSTAKREATRHRVLKPRLLRAPTHP